MILLFVVVDCYCCCAALLLWLLWCSNLNWRDFGEMHASKKINALFHHPDLLLPDLFQKGLKYYFKIVCQNLHVD